MKKRSCLFILFLLMTPMLFAQQSRFDEATQLLNQQEYREAINTYKLIADDGYISGALWLNMGIAYAQLDSLGMAKFYLIQAERHKETKELAQEALLYVEERLSRRSAVLPPLPWNRFFEFLQIQVGVTTVYLSGLFILYVGIALIIISWFRLRLQKPLRTSGVTLTGLSILIFVIAFYVQYLDNRYATGILTDRESVVYLNPNLQSQRISTAYEGYKMRADLLKSEEQTGWHYVRLENGMFGWIDDQAVNIF